uniref:Metallophos domain-containing protein n=1 Tax=Rhabditophanes sp. KR3021 TaxID=114890 RepID=A0AC35U248_9BILA
MTLHSPDAVFFLGDIFDEGQWCDKTQFDTYAARFNQLFKVDQNVKRVVVVGNHDVGFHYAIHPDRLSWFGETYANSTPVGTVTIKGQLFVLVNSMAMHGDYCQLCHSAEIEIDRIGGIDKRVIVAGRVTCNFKPSPKIEILLMEKEKYAMDDIEDRTTSDLDGNFFMNATVSEMGSMNVQLDLEIKIFHKCNMAEDDICYKVAHVPFPSTFFNYEEQDEETHMPRAYYLGTIELDGNHKAGRSCSRILGASMANLVGYVSKILDNEKKLIY